jgi:hypothetical protein
MMDFASPRVGDAAAAGKSSTVIATSLTGVSAAAPAGRAHAVTQNINIVHAKTPLNFMEKIPPAGAQHHAIAVSRRSQDTSTSSGICNGEFSQ